MDRVVFRRNLSGPAAILAHLRRCDDDFAVPLSHRVALEEYAAKLARRAERCEAWDGHLLVGLVAMYTTSTSGGCFISNVSVDPAYRQRGLGSLLLSNSIEAAQGLGATRLELEVDEESQGAQRLYSTMGFGPLAGKPSPWVRELR